MGRSSIWDGSAWVSMTGGEGESGGGGEPDDNYLRLDNANNNVAPNQFLRETDADGIYLQLTGGTISGDITLGNAVDIIGAANSLISAQNFQFTIAPGAFKNSSGGNVIIFQSTGIVTIEQPLQNEEGSYQNAYDLSPPLYGGGDQYWYQNRNIRFKDTAGPPSDSEGQDGDVTLNYTF